MSTNHESDTDELDGRTKLLSSRPEPDNILVFEYALGHLSDSPP